MEKTASLLLVILAGALGVFAYAVMASQLQNILKTVTMSQENLDLLLGKVNALETSLVNIKSDITRIKESLPAGAMTAEEVAALAARLDAVVTSADSLDKENEPDEPTSPSL